MNNPEMKMSGDKQKIEKLLLQCCDQNLEVADYAFLKEAFAELIGYNQELELNNQALNENNMAVITRNTQLNDIFDNAPIGYVIFDESLTILNCNASFAEMIGVQARQLTNKTLISYIAADSQDNFHFHILDLVRTETPQTCTISLVAKNSEVVVKIQSSIVKHDGAKEIRSAIVDITAEIRTEEKLESERNNLALIMSASPVAMLVIDEKKIIRTANPAAATLFNKTLPDLQSKFCGDFIGCTNRLIDNAGCGFSVACPACKIMQSIKTVFETRECVSNLESYLTRDDRAEPEIKWIRFSINPIQLMGSPFCIIALNDITHEKQHEFDLNESERKYKLLAEKTSDVIWLMDLQGKSIYVSPSIERFSGFTVDEYLQQTIESRFTLDSALKAKNIYSDELRKHAENEVALKEYSFTLELEYVCKNGSTKIGEVIVTPYFENSKLTGIHGLTRDITQRKRAEEKLKQEQLLLHTLIDNIPATVYVKDANGRKVIANKADIQVMGYTSVEQVYGKTDLELMPGDIGERGFRDDMEVILEGKRVINREEDFYDSDGNRIWLNTSKIPLINDTGEITGLVGIGHFVTQQKMAEDELKKERALLKTFVDNIPVSVFIKDRQSRKVLSNPADQANTQKTESQVLGRDDFELFLPEIAESFIRDDKFVMDNDQPLIDREEQIINLDGSVKHLLTTKIPWKNDSGEIIGIIGFSIDITGRKNTEEALKESEERFRAAFRISPDAISLTNLKTGKYIDINDGFIDLSGYTRDEIIGFTALEMNVWNEPADRQKLVDALNKDGYVNDLEAVFNLKNGKKITGLMSAKILTLNNEPHLLAVTKDITERKKIDDALKESEEKLKALINSTPDIICFKDAEGRWIQANDSLLELYQLQGVDYHNKNEFELAEFTAAIYQDAFRNCGDSDEGAWLKGETSQTEEMIPDVAGNLRVFDVIKIPLFHPDHSRKGLVVFGRDITNRKQMEEALLKNEEKYRLIAENTGDTIWIMNLDLKYTYISPAIFRLTGHTPDEEMARSLDQIFTPESMTIAIDLFKNQLELEIQGADPDRIVNIDLSILHKDGHPVYVHETMTFIRDKNGKAIGIQGITHDISDRKLAEEQIQQNEFRLQSLLLLSEFQTENVQQLLDYSLNEAVKLTKSESGFIFLYNDKTALLSLSSVSKNIKDLYDIEIQLMQFNAEEFGSWGEVLNQRKELILNSHSEFNPLMKGIAKGDMTIHRYLSIPVILDDKIVAVISVVNKLTEYEQLDVQQLKLMMNSVWKMVQRKKDEDKIRQLSKGIEQSPAAVVITDTNGYIEYVNPKFTEVTGHPESVVKGKLMRMLKPGIASEQMYNEIWQTIRAGNEWNGEFYNKKANNEFYWESVSISPITDHNGTIRHYIAIKVDISERKKMIGDLIQAKEKAEDVSKIKSRLLANMSHEIRTPLNGILGFAELLKDDVAEEDQKRMAEVIYASGSRLMNTLNSILDLSLIEAQADVIKLKSLDLNLLIEESSILFDAMAAKRGLFLYSQTSEQPIFAMGDENLINKILNNLINNALKFTKQGGVVVRAGLNRKNNTEYACITVHDTGIGIPAEYLEVIFEEFRQASEGHTRAFEGTGLGLHLASSFARIMNGEITVQSTEGKGSAFTLWLPAAVPLSWDDPVKLEPVSAIQNLDFLNKARILLVEDDKDSLDLALLILKSRYQCDFAVSGKGAVELASKNQYSCILMDISLKGEIGGIGAIDEIRKLPGYGAVPIAAFTANALSGHREEYLSKGCTHYLSKPYKRQELINLVDEMVLLRGVLN